MNGMKQLFENIRLSIYGPAYYRELLTRPASFSIKYYFALALLVALFLTIASSVPLLPRVNQTLRDLPAKFFAYYPDDLEVKIEKGVLSSNVAEPYFLPLPQVLKGAVRSGDAVDSLLVIDTKTPFSVERFNSDKVAVWLGREQIALRDSNGVRVEQFDPKMNLTVNERILRGFEQRLEPFYDFATPAVVIVLFLGLLFALCINFFYLFFGAALIFFLGRLLKQQWTYGASYRIGLHAVTLPVLLNMFTLLLGFPLMSFHLLFSAIMLAVVFVNFKDIVSETTPPSPTL